MTCAEIARAIVAYPDWLTAFAILFVAAVFGASCMCVYYEWRYRRGIHHQMREDEIAAAFRSTQGWKK